MTGKNFLFMIAAVFIFYPAVSVSQCVDTNKVNPYYICTDPYLPVCGCDGNVYRNACAALNQGGLYWYDSFENGGCATFDFDLVPTTVDQGYVDFGIYLKNQGSAYIAIFDVYGHKKYEENLGFIYQLRKRIEFNGYFRGVYIMYVEVAGEGKVLKFVKANEN